MANEKKTYSLEIEGQHGNFTVTNLTMNGTNYVSENEVDTSAWPHAFQLTAKDETGAVTEHYAHAKLIQQEQYAWGGGKYYLAFSPVSEQEVKNAEFQATLEYIAMMADIDIDN